MTPIVTFIEGTPPPAKASRTTGNNGWVQFALGILATRPGEWARILRPGDDEFATPPNINSIKKSGESLGLEVEVTRRDGMLYMRVVA